MFDSMKRRIEAQIQEIRSAGLYKEERVPAPPPGAPRSRRFPRTRRRQA